MEMRLNIYTTVPSAGIGAAVYAATVSGHVWVFRPGAAEPWPAMALLLASCAAGLLTPPAVALVMRWPDVCNRWTPPSAVVVLPAASASVVALLALRELPAVPALGLALNMALAWLSYRWVVNRGRVGPVSSIDARHNDSGNG